MNSSGHMSDFQVHLDMYLKATGIDGEVERSCAAGWFAEEWRFTELLGEDMPDPVLCAEDYLSEQGGQR